MKKIILTGLLISSQLLSAKSLSFQHHDWQVVCDNTHLCRIAGYSSYSTENRVSVLITREAGARKKMKAKLQLGLYGEDDEKLFKSFPSSFKLKMLINEKSHGFVSMKNNDLVASLSDKQTSALITSLSESSHIAWKYKEHYWELSDKGSTAVLLKADEFQKRINTRNAFYKKGNKSEKNVLKAKAIPVIYAERIVDDKEIVIKDKVYIENLRSELRSQDEYCFDSDYRGNDSLTFYNLNSSKMVVSKPSWAAAYNFGSCSWTVNKKQPFSPKIVFEGDYYVDQKNIGTVSHSHKGRGLGDCWSHESYVWTGKIFVLNSIGTTGLCRLISPGGAWSLPTFVSKLKVR